jgi:formate dehydrogenase iron-sulfur subunit
MLVDVTRCIGCRSCVRACDARNGLPSESGSGSVWEAGREKLTYDQWTVVELLPAAQQGREPVSVKRQCMHCISPACVSVCPVGALIQRSDGAVVYRQERCIGCRYCVFACPFGIPRFQWDAGLTPVIGKCQFCAQHAVFTGPACATACPTGALKFGKRGRLLAEARGRIHARPRRYIDHVYGEEEVGGTAWLYLAGQPFSTLGFREDLPRVPLPQLTWIALKAIPAAVTILVLLLGLLSFRLRPAVNGRPHSSHA